MGGCRCTYRNCTLRSDGKTHMFHYPVFDKVRCHQWLTNAHKLEFLNLKVSQLKNRVVCQHHFKDENFMNFKKDKLTFDAVPTEDGPYCDSSQLKVEPTEPEVKAYSIALEDIENEYAMTLSDKKANFSVKYGDFLTNCDIMDLDAVNYNYNTQIDNKQKEVQEPASVILNDNNARKSLMSNITLVDTKPREIRRYEKQMEYNGKKRSLQPSTVQVQFDQLLVPPKVQNLCPVSNIQANESYTSQKITMTSVPKEKKVRIISEEQVQEPVPLIGKLEPISPTKVLPLPKKKRELNTSLLKPKENNDLIEITIDTIIPSNVEPPGMVDVPKISEIQIDKSPPTKCKIVPMKSKTNSEVQSNIALLKNKIPQMGPERIAAIEQKRKFNMKLRDIIETCLDKLDDQEKIEENIKYPPKLEMKQISQEKVSKHLSQDQKLPSIDQYTIAYLDDKMKKMEDNLINRINQNSYRIMDLKKSLSPLADKKSTHTQTSVSEEQQKKYLYQEISKYLSPEANSLIYEELFINKYVQNVSNRSISGKRRKYR